MRGRSVGALVAYFVILGILACADGVFGAATYRSVVLQYGVLAAATLYLCAVLHSAEGSHRVFPILAAIGMAAAAVMVLPSSAIPFLWVPFVVLPLVLAFTAVLFMRSLARDVANIAMDVFTLGFRPKDEPPIIPIDVLGDVQAALLAVWVTAGGMYIVGRVLALPYIEFLEGQSMFRGFLDVRALILVTLIVPAAARAAVTVRGFSPADSFIAVPQHTAQGNNAWELILSSLATPLRRLAHLVYRVAHYIGMVVLAWSRVFAQLLRDMLINIEVYKASGKILLMFSACALLALSSPLMTAALTDYLRQEPPWSGGSLNAFLALAWVVGGLLELLLLSLLVTASLLESKDESNVVAAAEFLGWGLVSAACASVVLWLVQHYPPAGVVGFVSPGIVAAVPGVIVLIYLVRLLRSPGNTAGG